MIDIIERNAVRAILLTPDHEILLLRIRLPESAECFWIAPGGGLEPGEAIEDGLKRELREELTLDKYDIGPLVWLRQHTFNWAGKRICQRERYYIVHVNRFEPRMSDAEEVRVLDRFRWWPATELAGATERLTPLSLAEIVTRYIAHGPPRETPPLEVLVD